MALLELVLSAVIAVAAGIGSGLPVAAWQRTREPRFLLVAASSLALLIVGLLVGWAQAQPDPPAFAQAAPLVLGLIAAAAILLLATGLIPRRS